MNQQPKPPAGPPPSSIQQSQSLRQMNLGYQSNSSQNSISHSMQQKHPVEKSEIRDNMANRTSTFAKPTSVDINHFQHPNNNQVNAFRGSTHQKPLLPSIFYYDFDNPRQPKPWLNQKDDITDYFNYGFTEELWKEYVEKTKSLNSNTAKEAVEEKTRDNSKN